VALPHFWRTVFQNSGLIDHPDDLEAFDKLSVLTCELLDVDTSNIKLSFKFSEEPALFVSKELVIETKSTLVE
jgi:hypothetical protein